VRVSIATQLNSIQLDVELSCVAINGPLRDAATIKQSVADLTSSVTLWGLNQRSYSTLGPVSV